MTQDLDAELKNLWNRRGELDAPGLTRLYQLVVARLGRTRPPELGSLPDPTDHYIQDFFTQKALWSTTGTIDHPNVLVTYFRRFLRDCLDKQRELHNAQPVVDEDGHETITAQDTLHADRHPDPEAAAHETALDEATVAAAARRFLDALEDWARDYLALSFCPDRGTPLSTLARARRIASHHYKAQKLGITRRKGETWHGYRDTDIGRWLVSLGIEPEPEQAEEIFAALKILCWQALLQQEARNGKRDGQSPLPDDL